MTSDFHSFVLKPVCNAQFTLSHHCLFKKQLFIFMCMSAVLHYVCSQSVCLVPVEIEEDVESPGTRIIGGCKPPSGYWSQNMVLLQE